MTANQLALDHDALKKATRKGVIAALLLGVLTVVEFYVAINLEDPLFALMPFILAKGWIILDSFMHIRALFSEDH
ncbi:MAG: hypothetical protein BMS9Abin17_1344 [Acidimicrobiia bacterium]|nr:MAG: hypothetical protein BMS9Abin17_1344 [Acidimicrobiia bacterium]